MKKTLLLTVVLMCLPGLMAGQARWRKKTDKHDDYHFMYASFGVGYSSLTAPQVRGTIEGDYGLLGGIGYEFRHGSFWLSVGGQVSQMNNRMRLEPYTFGSIDPTTGTQIHGYVPYQGGKRDALLQYEIQQTDLNQWNAIDIPIMLGLYKHGFYVGAGVKAGVYYFNSSIKATADYKINYKFPEYISTPNFDYSDQVYGYSNKVEGKFRPQVAIIGEVGYDILSMIPTRSLYCHVLKVGFYWEVGVTSMRQKDITYVEQNMILPDATTKEKQMVINPYLMSKIPDGNANKEFVAPFLTGVKITYMFGGSRTGSRGTLHKGCQCYNN